MSKPEFLAGSVFNYKGHFRTLARHALLLDQNRYCLVDQETKDEWFTVQNIDDDGFELYTADYGRIMISYKECRLKKNTPTN